MREALERLLETLEESPNVAIILQAPTGYGKTSLSPKILRVLRKSGGPRSLIHSLPLRAIVEDAYSNFVNELLEEAQIGYQAHGLGLPGKSPFMAPDLVVTTLDSLLLNLIGANVAERKLGHYLVPRAFIYSAAVVLDEAHLPLRSGDTALYEAVQVATWMLAYSGNPIILETATLPGGIVYRIASLLKILGPKTRLIEPIPVGANKDCMEYYRHIGVHALNVMVECVEDQEYYDRAASVKWTFEPLKNGIQSKILEYYEKGLSVFRAVNTVINAVDEYLKLVDSLGPDRVALIHGRMTPKDRREQLERIKHGIMKGQGILVGTSAVEAGVNLDLDVLITDVVNIDSLIQRIGRVNRGNNRPESHVVITGDGSEELASKFSVVNPRIPYDYKGIRGYKKLLDQLPTVEKRQTLVRSEISRLMISLMDPLLQEELLKRLTSIACGLIREEPLITVTPHPEDLNVTLEELIDYIDDYAFPLNLGLAKRRGILEEPEPGYVSALVMDIEGYRDHPDYMQFTIKRVKAPWDLGCADYIRLLERERVAALILSKGSYRAGVGLVGPRGGHSVV